MAFTQQELQDAYKLIEEKKNAAMALITEAQDVADKFGLEFSLEVSYGMGGTYHPALSDEAKGLGGIDHARALRAERHRERRGAHPERWV